MTSASVCTLLGVWLNARYKRATDKENTSTSQFEQVTHSQQQFVAQITSQLQVEREYFDSKIKACELKCAKCEMDHQQTKGENLAMKMQIENQKLRIESLEKKITHNKL